jgi:hypothetical protein
MPGRRALLASLVLGACASRPPAPPAPLAGVPQLSCVPFARALSGIDLRGDAWRCLIGRTSSIHRPWLPASLDMHLT